MSDDTEGRKLYRERADALARTQINIARRKVRKSKGCYFTEASMMPQCRMLWERAEDAERLFGELNAAIHEALNILPSGSVPFDDVPELFRRVRETLEGVLERTEP